MFKMLIKWVLIIVPPLLLAWYHDVPIDLPVFILYIPVPLIFIWSCVSIARISIFIFRKPEPIVIGDYLGGIRPVLCICVLAFVYFAHRSSLNGAKKFAAQTAIQSHQYFLNTSRYPMSLDGWKSGVSRSGSQECTIRTDNRIGVRYNITFVAKKDSSSTLVRVNHDEAFEVTSTSDGRFSLAEDYFESDVRKSFMGASELMKYLGD